MHTTLEQLLVLANRRSLNAEFIHMDLPQDDLIKQLNDIALFMWPASFANPSNSRNNRSLLSGTYLFNWPVNC